MLSAEEVAALIVERQQQLTRMQNDQHLRASEADRLMTEIEAYLRVLQLEPLDALDAQSSQQPQQGQSASGTDVPDETQETTNGTASGPTLEQPSRWDTLVTTPQVRAFGRQDVVCLSLPPLLRPPFVRPSRALFLTRNDWRAIQALRLVDPRDPWDEALDNLKRQRRAASA